MPEIGEVELVRRGLEPLIGSTVAALSLNDSRLGSVEQFAALQGRQVTDTVRHGKLLGIGFDDLVLAIHLRMTGKLLWERSPKARLLLEFDPAGTLSFADQRRFGTAEVVAREDFGATLGPDLLAGDATDALIKAGERSRRAVKAVILDQQVVAGIGNYIADEALWRAALHPELPANKLTAADWQLLVDSAREVATTAIEAGGASFRDYRRTDGSLGTMQDLMKCYGRDGEPCLRCGSTLTKRTVAGRGSTFCTDCQRSS